MQRHMADKVLSHKGYLGSVEMSLEDNCLFGEVLFVNDLVNYEGATVEELQKAFVEAIDHYLARCAEEGLTPDKPFSGTFNVRFAPEIHKSACLKAALCGVSLNEFVKSAVLQALAEEKTVVNETHNHTHIHTVEIVSAQSYEEPKTLWRGVEKQKITH